MNTAPGPTEAVPNRPTSAAELNDPCRKRSATNAIGTVVPAAISAGAGSGRMRKL